MATFDVGHAPLAAGVRPERGAKSTGMLPPFDISTCRGGGLSVKRRAGVQMGLFTWKWA